MLISLAGQNTLSRILSRPSLLTRSKAYVRSVKAIYNDIFCSLHFSCSCFSEIMSMADISALKLHCDSEEVCKGLNPH